MAKEISEKELESAIQTIRQGIDAYNQSDFNSAIKQLNEGLIILEQSLNKLKATNQLIDAHLHLGLAYIGVNDMVNAKKQFSNIFSVDPYYQLDKSAYSTKVLSLFNEAKVEFMSNYLKENSEETAKPSAPPPQQTRRDTEDSQDEPKEKPFYKKWWFWTLTGAATVGVVAAASGSDETDSDEDSDVLLSEDFSSGTFGDWQIHTGINYWKVENGVLRHYDHEWTDWDVIRAGAPDWRVGYYRAEFGDFTGDIYDYEFAFIFGLTDDESFYFVIFSPGNVCLHRYIDGAEEILDSTEYYVNNNQAYSFETNITAMGIEVIIDGVPRLYYQTTDAIYGAVGIVGAYNAPISFDNILVKKYNEGSSMVKSRSKIPQKQTRLPLKTTRKVALGPLQ